MDPPYIQYMEVPVNNHSQLLDGFFEQPVTVQELEPDKEDFVEEDNEVSSSNKYLSLWGQWRIMNVDACTGNMDVIFIYLCIYV